MALSVPLAPWLKAVFCNRSVPPSARSTLLLVTPAVLLIVIPALSVDAMVPLLTSASAEPMPTWPAP